MRRIALILDEFFDEFQIQDILTKNNIDHVYCCTQGNNGILARTPQFTLFSLPTIHPISFLLYIFSLEKDTDTQIILCQMKVPRTDFNKILTWHEKYPNHALGWSGGSTGKVMFEFQLINHVIGSPVMVDWLDLSGVIVCKRHQFDIQELEQFQKQFSWSPHHLLSAYLSWKGIGRMVVPSFDWWKFGVRDRVGWSNLFTEALDVKNNQFYGKIPLYYPGCIILQIALAGFLLMTAFNFWLANKSMAAVSLIVLVGCLGLSILRLYYVL